MVRASVNVTAAATAAAVLLAVACAAAATGGVPHAPTPNSRTLLRAYYILSMDDLSSPTWPAAFASYSTFIVQPLNFTRAMVDKVRTDIPGSRVLAYFDSQDIPIKSGCSTGDPMGDKPGRMFPGDGPYYEALRDAFPAKWAVYQLPANGDAVDTVCLYPGLAAYFPMADSVAALAKFHFDITFEGQPAGPTGRWDGLYLDNQVATAAERVSELSALGVPVDTNGDGKPDSAADTLKQWLTFRPQYTRALREAIGPQGVLIGNSAGALGDPALNGITVEMEACQEWSTCLDALEGQHAVSVEPAASVLWLTHSEEMPASKQCSLVSAAQKQLSYVAAGTDFFDGSHIVCNNTAAEQAQAAATAPSASVYSKIGFHLGPGGDSDHVADFMTQLDAAKIPFFMKSVDDYGLIGQGAALAAKSGVPHTLVWRNTNFDIPDYSKDPATAASEHWNKTMTQMPPNFDKERVWLELINEPDQSKCDWLGNFSVAAGNIAMSNGYKFAAFSWATGNPPVEAANPGQGCWQTPGALAYLRLVAANQDKLAVALHEYSLTVDNILAQYPYLLGRFKFLFDACDQHGIARPKVLITEWGWEAFNVPGADKANADVDLAMNKAYAHYPEVLGGAIWYLGPGFQGIAGKADQLVEPLLNHTLHTTYPSLN